MKTRRLYGYTAGRSFLHRSDALSKLAWIVFFPTLPFVYHEPVELVVLVGATLLTALVLAHVPAKPLAKVLLFLVALSLALVFFQVLIHRTGAVAFRVGSYAVYQDGLVEGFRVTCRIVVIILGSLVFVISTNPRDLVVGLVRLGMKYRYAWSIFLALISIPVFGEEIVSIREAQLVRGTRSGGLAGRFEMYRRYLLPLLACVMRRVETVAIAMDARAFGLHPTRTFIDAYRLTWRGAVFVAFWLAAVVVGLFRA